MKKSSMKTLVAFFAMQNGLPSDVVDAVDEIKAELAKEEEEKAEKVEAYEAAKKVVLEALAMAGTNITITELYEECKDELPEGFTKGQVQYGVTRLWIAEIEKIEGKPNTYKVRA